MKSRSPRILRLPSQAPLLYLIDLINIMLISTIPSYAISSIYTLLKELIIYNFIAPYYLCHDELYIFIATTKWMRLHSRHDECRIFCMLQYQILNMLNDWWLTQVPESPPEERSAVPPYDWTRWRFLAPRQLRWLRISRWTCVCWNLLAPPLLPDDSTSFDPASTAIKTYNSNTTI